MWKPFCSSIFLPRFPETVPVETVVALFARTVGSRCAMIESFLEIFTKISDESFQLLIITEFLFNENSLLVAVRPDVNFG